MLQTCCKTRYIQNKTNSFFKNNAFLSLTFLIYFTQSYKMFFSCIIKLICFLCFSQNLFLTRQWSMYILNDHEYMFLYSLQFLQVSVCAHNINIIFVKLQKAVIHWKLFCPCFLILLTELIFYQSYCYRSLFF